MPWFGHTLSLFCVAALVIFAAPRFSTAQEMEFDEGESDPVEVETFQGEEGEDAPLEDIPLDEAFDTTPALPAYGFAVPNGEGQDDTAREVQRIIRDVLIGNENFSLTRADGVLHGRDVVADDALTEAQQLFQNAREAYDNLELDAAAEQFSLAIDAYEEQVAHLDDFADVTDCLLYLGAARILAGSERSGQSAFGSLLIIDPERRPDPDLFPPPVVQSFESVVSRMRRVRDGSISVTTSPPGADVYVDGVLLGSSPQEMPGLKSGRHYVRAQMQGYGEVGRVVEIRRGREASVSLDLEPTEEGPVIAELLDQLPGQLEERPDDAIGTVQRVGEILGVEILITVVLNSSPEGTSAVMHAWDVLRGERLSRQTAGPIEGEGLAVAAELQEPITDLASVAWSAQNVNQVADVPPVEQAPIGPTDPIQPARPFYRTWWFWTIVSAAAVGAGLGIGFGVAAANDAPGRTNGELILDL